MSKPLEARLAVSGMFFLNGLMVGSWAPKVPVVMDRLGIGESVMGLLVLCLGIGSVAMMPVFGALVARRGSVFAVWLGVVACAPALLMISLAPNPWIVGLAIAWFGATMGGMDVAMNANAVSVERNWRRAIMSSCHGFWSLGGLTGAGIGGVAITYLGETGHAAAVTVAVAVGLLLLHGRLLQDAPEPGAEGPAPLRLPRSPLPYIIGFVALCCMIPEGAILDWAAVYLRRELGASLSVAGLGFAACAGTMAIMRFLGDLIRQKLGAVSTLRISAVTAMIGLGVAGFAPVPEAAIVGFGIAGIGLANMVPIAFSAAGNVPGLGNGIGLSVVTTMGYSGILLAPGSIGFLAEKLSLSTIFVGLAALLLLPLLLSPLARTADFDKGH